MNYLKNMNDIHNILFIGVILEEDQDKNFMRIVKRNLRDTMNAFEMPEIHFKQMFRLDKKSVINLINELEPFVNREGNIPLNLKILATLNFTATGSFQNLLGCNCWISLSQSSISRSINEICYLITEHLLPNWVKFPTEREDKNYIKQGFYEKWGVRGVLGIIDGTHVEIIAPPMADEQHPPFVYINRKGRHSINVMLISDSDTKIIGCNARYPGSVHDAAIWQMGNVKNYLRTEYENGDKLSHLLGDSGYPLEPWLFTPFSAVQEGSNEARFNVQFNTVRNVIERTNGILKGRFRCLSRHRTLLYHPVKAAKIIYTCCVFHNMAVQANLPMQEDEIEYRENQEAINIENFNDNEVFQLGRAARNEYIRNNII